MVVAGAAGSVLLQGGVFEKPMQKALFCSGVSNMSSVEAKRHAKSKRPLPGNYRKAPATALMQDMFLRSGSLGQAYGSCQPGGAPLVGQDRIEEIRKLLSQAQMQATSAVQPLLQAHSLLLCSGRPPCPGTSLAEETRKLKRLQEALAEATEGGDAANEIAATTMQQRAAVAALAVEEQLRLVEQWREHEAGQVLLRNARAAVRDAIVYFLLPLTLGLDSRPDFVRALRSILPEDDEQGEGWGVFSSQMQNAYQKLLRNLQEWFKNTDFSSGSRSANPDDKEEGDEERKALLTQQRPEVVAKETSPGSSLFPAYVSISPCSSHSSPPSSPSSLPPLSPSSLPPLSPSSLPPAFQSSRPPRQAEEGRASAEAVAMAALGDGLCEATSKAAVLAWQWRAFGMTHVDIFDEADDEADEQET